MAGDDLNNESKVVPNGCPARPHPALTGLNILVIDDDADALALALTMLRRAGTTTAAARSAAEAYQLFRSRPVPEARRNKSKAPVEIMATGRIETEQLPQDRLTNSNAEIAALQPLAKVSASDVGATDVAPDAAPFDMILCDISMPEENGYQFIERIRSLEAQRGHSPIRAAALTAHARDEDRQQSLRSGFNAHITKPYSYADLTQAMLRLVETTF